MEIKLSATLKKDLTFTNDKGEQIKYHRLVLHIGGYDKTIKLTLPEVCLLESLIQGK